MTDSNESNLSDVMLEAAEWFRARAASRRHDSENRRR